MKPCRCFATALATNEGSYQAYTFGWTYWPIWLSPSHACTVGVHLRWSALQRARIQGERLHSMFLTEGHSVLARCFLEAHCRW